MIAAALALACFTIFTMGHGARIFRRTDIIETHFHRINGLQPGAPVALSGVNIGAVESIRFPSDRRADYVIVRMWIADADLERVRSDAVAEINTMGLLGDKFVEIAGGSPDAPAIGPDEVLAAHDPVDYQTLLQKQGASDMIANLIEISQSMRSILNSIDKGNGLLSEMIRGEQNGQPQLTLEDIRGTLINVNRLTAEMDVILAKVNRGEGLAGAMFSGKTNGEQLLKQVNSTAVGLDQTSHELNRLIDRFNTGNGVVQRLLSDQKYANRLLNNLQISLNDMKQILRKINDGQGSVGLAVNDPALYHEAKDFLGPNGSAGWGVKILNGLYSVTHPFSHSPAATEPLTAPSSVNQTRGAQAAPMATAPGSAPSSPSSPY